MVNACLDRLRKRAAPPSRCPTTGRRSPQKPRDRVSERETAMAVHEALLQIPADQRAAVVAVDVEGFSVADAARALGVAEGAIKSRCARGRVKLAVLLGHLRDNGDDPVAGNRPAPPRVATAVVDGGEEES